MFHAKSDRSRVHDLETAGDDFLVADVVKTGRFRILDRVSRINTVDLRRLHDHVAFAFDGAESSTAVRRKERIARTGREDHPLLP